MIGLVAAAALTAAGCSSSGGSGSGDYSVADAVNQIPPSVVDGEILIYTGDLITATEVAGLELPKSPDDATQWMFDLTYEAGVADADVPVFVPIGDLSGAGAKINDFEGFEAELGWSIFDIRSFVEFSVPPGVFAVVNGDFDDPLDRLDELDGGVFTHGSGEDFEQDLNNRNPVDQLGRPIRFGEKDGRVAISTSTSAVEEWLEAQGSGRVDLMAMAEALDDADAYAAVLHSAESGYSLTETFPFPPEDVERIIGEDWLPTEPFHAVAIGWSVDDDGAVLTFVFAHDDNEGAEANVERFERLFAEASSIVRREPIGEIFDLTDVTAADNLVVVTATPAGDSHVSTALQSLVARDVPFAHI